MPVPLKPRVKLERQLQALRDRRRVIDRQIWALEQEIAALPVPEKPPRLRATDPTERREMASA